MRFASTLAAGIAIAVFAAPPGLAQPVHEDLDTPFVITPTNVVTAMLDLAAVAPGDRLIDLGSGDGRIVFAAAQRGAIAVGIEIDTYLVEQSRESARRMKLEDRVRFVEQDLFETDFAGYDVVTLYLLPDVNKRLAPKLIAKLKPGARIVSHDYGLGDWPPDKTIVVDAPDKPVNVEKKSTIHFWRVPAHVEGRWRGEAAGEPVALELRQHFQHVSGAFHWAQREYRFTDRRIDGDVLALELVAPGAPALLLDLRASGDRLVGELRRSGEEVIVDLARR
jgi:SAM-dependent methyltransferase